MTIISIGATLTDRLQWSEVLIEKVNRLLASYEDAVSLRVVQIPFFLISHSSEIILYAVC